MPLKPRQIDELASAIDRSWNLQDLTRFADDHLDVDLNNLAPDGSLYERAHKFVAHLNSQRPAKDRLLLELLARHGNVSLRMVADKLLQPEFISTRDGDAHYAVNLGKAAFLGRQALRRKIPDFTDHRQSSTRVLVVSGHEACGKSYTYLFLQLLAHDVLGAKFHYMELSQQGSATARAFYEDVGRSLGLDLNVPPFPKLSDDPQEARTAAYRVWLDGQLDNLQSAHMLVIDDLNDPGVGKAVVDAAYTLARVAELKKGELWVALLGYNRALTDSVMDFVTVDEAAFPDVESVATYFELLSAAGPKPLSTAKARDWAELLYENKTIDKDTMYQLKKQIEELGEKFMRGQQP